MVVEGRRVKTVKFVEGFHDISPDVQEFLGRGWTVYNAPRPLYGQETWTGAFRHGIFYAAVPPDGDPADEFKDAARNREDNERLDGWKCVIVTRDDIKRYYDELLARYPAVAEVYPWPQSYEQVVHSWFNSLDEEE